MLTEWGLDRVTVAGFDVADASRADVVAALVAMSEGTAGRPTTAYALHVSGLNSHRDLRFAEAMNRADLVYADGGAVVALGRLAGARSLERAPTTDIGWEVLRGISERLGRPVRFALVGGPPGLARRAAQTLEGSASGVCVAVVHGYHTDWRQPLADLADADPEIVFVGMGAPREMTWVREHLAELPPVPILTCGGWFGFLSGDERRAPGVIRKSGLEWVSRVWQNPRRLAPRYARGCLVTAGLLPDALMTRMSRGFTK